MERLAGRRPPRAVRRPDDSPAVEADRGRAAADLARWCLFLDFDGTLVDIAERPDSVVVEAGLPALLDQLRDRLGGALAIVTGRTVADLDTYLPGFDTCGLHGLDRRVAGRMTRPTDLSSLAPEVTAIRARFATRPGVLVEDKGVGVAVHWRTAPDAMEAVIAAVTELADRLGPGYRVQAGKAVREIVPVSAGKGGAIRDLCGTPPYLGRRPVFAGDDVTDEGGFSATNALGGVSVKVGIGPTAASHRAASTTAFRAWLAAFATGAVSPADLPAVGKEAIV